VTAVAGESGRRDLLRLQLDRTGTRDIVYLAGTSLDVLYNPRRGPSVSEVARVEVDGNMRGLVAGDFDHDGAPDVAALSFDTGRIEIFGFDVHGRIIRREYVAVGPGPQSMVAADVDRDGWLDIAVTFAISETQDAVGVLVNRHGRLSMRGTGTPIGRAPFGLVAADFDGDGAIDLAAANALSSSVSVLLNDGAGAFPSADTYPAGTGPWDLVAVDLDRDGIQDLVTTNAESLDISVLQGVGGGTFAPERRFAATLLPAFPPNETLVAGDLTGDGIPDVMLSNGSLLPGTGDGGFGPPLQFALASNTITVAHLDDDGRLDVIVDRPWTDQVSGVILAWNRPLVANRPPVPVVADVVAHFGERATFDATASFDPDGHLLAFAWQDELGRPLGTLPTQSAIRLPGSYAYTVTVRDALGAIAVRTVQLTVDGEAPRYADIVLYAADARVLKGNWQRVSDASAADGVRLQEPNRRAAKQAHPRAHPASYFELEFAAHGNTVYQLWIRGKAAANSWRNDSVYVQFSSTVNFDGAPRFRIGSTDGLLYSLEPCVNCGVSGWGWNGDGLLPFTDVGQPIIFDHEGRQTIRIQTREDGLSIDQIVLSSVTYLFLPPGAAAHDDIVLPRTQR
jgi:hypothetical protein